MHGIDSKSSMLKLYVLISEQTLFFFLQICRYSPRDPTLTSETYYFKRGTNQLFCQPTHVFDPSRYTDEELLFNPEKEIIPIAIHCVAYEGPEGKYK